MKYKYRTKTLKDFIILHKINNNKVKLYNLLINLCSHYINLEDPNEKSNVIYAPISIS